MIEALGELPVGTVDTYFLLLSGREGDLADTARGLGAQIDAVPISWRLPLHYRRLLARVRPDVVHSHVHFFSGPLLAVAAWMRVPIRIAHLHSTTDIRGHLRQTWARRARRLVYQWLIRRYATEVIAVSQAALDANPTLHSKGSAARVFYSAVDTSSVEDVLADHDASMAKVVQIGRLDPEKNQLLALEVFRAALEQRAEAEFWIVGRPAEGYGTTIERRIEELSLGESVRLCGLRTDVMTSILPTAVAMLQTSTVEGMSGVVLEALATGTPVVASDIPPHREVASLLDGVTLVGLAEPVSAWAEALVPLIDRPATKAERLVSLAAFRASPFSLEQHVPRLLALWGIPEPT